MAEITAEKVPCPACGHPHSDPAQLTFDYMSESARTCGPTWYGERIPLGSFVRTANAAVVFLASLDDIKKSAFYGRKLPDVLLRHTEIATLDALRHKLAQQQSIGNEQRATDIIHAIIGKATEASELLEALVDVAINDDEQFDAVNAIEEIGDGLWYDALLLRALGSDFEHAMQKNIAKLRTRFPDKFDEHHANHRDLVKEREVLEGKL